MAQSAPGKTGNLNIFNEEDDAKKKSKEPGVAGQSHLIEDEKEDEKEDVSADYREVTLEKTEATVIYHFFRNKDLKTIVEKYSCLMTRFPSEGQVKFLLIKYKKKYAEDVTKHIVKMRLQMKEFHKKDFSFKAENSRKLAEFLEKPERSEDPVCYIPDIAKGSVEIFGIEYEDTSQADHKLKLYLGEVKQTGTRRQVRRTSDSEIDSPTNQSASYADVTKYSKSRASGDKSRSFVRSFSSSSSAYGSSSADSFSFEATLNNGFVLKVYKASITNLDVEVIVNAANENMMHGGGVARVISEAAGWELDDESGEYVKQNGILKVAENIVTTAGNLRQYRGVIHAVGPVWYQYREKMQCLDDLSDCVYNILETCQKKDYRTVAMSAISAGIFAVPKELCADMYVDAAARFSKHLKPGDCPRELHIIDIDTSILKLVEVSVKKWQKDPQSINARLTLPKFLEENPHQAGRTSSDSYGHHRGQRRQGHGGGGQNFYNGQGQRNDRENNTSRTFTGQTSTSLGTISNTHNLTNTLKYEKEEKFRWGGRAKVYKMDEKITVKIFKGEINKAQNMDAVVCSMDKYFSCTGFIAKALKTSGGSEYIRKFQKMEREYRSFAHKGFVYKCKAGDLGVDHVMHIIMDKVLDAKPEETACYQGHIYTILNKADDWDFQKLVIPLIGTGNIQTNEGKLKAYCIAVLKGVDEYRRDSQGKGKVTDIHLVNNDELVNKTLVGVFDEAVNMPTMHGNRSVQESYGGSRNENRSGRSSQESGGGNSGRRQRESRDDWSSPNGNKKTWEKFEDDSGKDGSDGGSKGKSSSEKSYTGMRSAPDGSGQTHSSGQNIQGAARNTATPESNLDEASDGKSKRMSATANKEEKKPAGNLVIIDT